MNVGMYECRKEGSRKVVVMSGEVDACSFGKNAGA